MPVGGIVVDKPYKCPRCGGLLIPVGYRLPSFLTCIICGLAVRIEDAEDHATEVDDET